MHTRFKQSVVPVPKEPIPSSGLFVLKAGKYNAKLGRRFTKGPWIGAPIFALTLEERATCWSGCINWDRCYGNSMPFAHRYRHGPELEAAMQADVHFLATKYPNGFAVRLHVLGDFYSPTYVARWAYLLQEYPSLRLWGYTHWPHGSPIGDAVAGLVKLDPARASFLRSDATDPDDPLPRAMTVGAVDPPLAGTVSCPEQTGRTPLCSACGLCMLGRVSISFHDHSAVGRATKRRTLQAHQ